MVFGAKLDESGGSSTVFESIPRAHLQRRGPARSNGATNSGWPAGAGFPETHELRFEAALHRVDQQSALGLADAGALTGRAAVRYVLV